MSKIMSKGEAALAALNYEHSGEAEGTQGSHRTTFKRTVNRNGADYEYEIEFIRACDGYCVSARAAGADCGLTDDEIFACAEWLKEQLGSGEAEA